ncbi:hypothetical protein LIA77_00399 [Sarocladium implicatum]|nr:hypothetical protein LIA77_00399 [Sarocladium implicatum]
MVSQGPWFGVNGSERHVARSDSADSDSVTCDNALRHDDTFARQMSESLYVIAKGRDLVVVEQTTAYRSNMKHCQ